MTHTLNNMDLSALVGSGVKLRHIALALAIDEQGSLVRAAESLYLTQPALSRALRELESSIGAELFKRTPSGMITTQIGRVVLDHFREIVGHIETMERRVTELAAPGTGSVVIGAHVTGANSLVPRAVGRLLDRWPSIDVTIREAPPNALIQELLGGGLDLLVGRVTDHSSTQGLELTPLYRETFRIAFGPNHPVAIRKPSGIEEFQTFKWVVPIAGTPLRDSWEHAFEQAGVPLPKIMVECGSSMPAKVLVRDFGFLSVLPESLLLGETDLDFLDDSFFTMSDAVGMMLAPSRNPTAAATLMIEALKAEASDLASKFGRAS